MTLKEIPTAAHHLNGQADSDNLNSPDVHEESTVWKFKGHVYFAAGHWPANEDAVP